MFTLNVLVKMPNGTVRRCEVVRETVGMKYDGSSYQFQTEKAALDWARFVLPSKVEVVKE